MVHSDNKKITNYVWAVGINLVVFVIIWYAFGTIPMPAKPDDEIPPLNGDSTAIADTGPGETFGQLTHLVGNGSIEGDLSTDEGESIETPSPKEPVTEEEPVEIVEESPEPVEAVEESPEPVEAIEESEEPVEAVEEPVISSGDLNQPAAEIWINEFFLDRGPALSFAPRLNPDGTPRPHPFNPDREKAPTYEDQQAQYAPGELNWPVMTPGNFPKQDLPEELREYNLVLTVQVHIDGRGKLLSDPVLVQGSGHPIVDELTLDKIKNQVSFSNASVIASGEPVPLKFVVTVFWEDPVVH